MGNQWDWRLAKCFFFCVPVCVWEREKCKHSLLVWISLSIQSVIFEFRSGVNLSFNISLEVCTLARLQHGKCSVCLSFCPWLCVSVAMTSFYSFLSFSFVYPYLSSALLLSLFCDLFVSPFLNRALALCYSFPCGYSRSWVSCGTIVLVFTHFNQLWTQVCWRKNSL